jgi:thiaminase
MTKDALFLRHYLKKWTLRFQTGDMVEARVLIALKAHYIATYGFEAHDQLCREVYLEAAKEQMAACEWKPQKAVGETPRPRRKERRGRQLPRWR